MEITDIHGYTVLSNGKKMPYLGLGVYKSKNGRLQVPINLSIFNVKQSC